MNKSMGQAVITGASSGIGAIYADRLARRGYDLLLVARDRERMDALASRLAADTGRKAKILPADLTDSNDLAGVETVLREDPRITLLVNNAGMAATASLLNSDVAGMSRLVMLNVYALTRLTYAAVPGFVKAEGMVDAALSGLDQGEFVTIPALPDAGQWQAYEVARQTLLPNLSRREPADRYAMVRASGGNIKC